MVRWFQLCFVKICSAKWYSDWRGSHVSGMGVRTKPTCSRQDRAQGGGTLGEHVTGPGAEPCIPQYDKGMLSTNTVMVCPGVRAQ
jgi:hypothetical protein